MDKYIKSYLFAGCLGMIIFGIGALFIDYVQMPVRILMAACLIAFGGAGLFLMMKTDKLNFSSMASQKLTIGMVLRSGVMAFGAVYVAYTTYNIFGLRHPFTLMFMALALASAFLLPYHYNLYVNQNRQE